MSDMLKYEPVRIKIKPFDKNNLVEVGGINLARHTQSIHIESGAGEMPIVRLGILAPKGFEFEGDAEVIINRLTEADS